MKPSSSPVGRYRATTQLCAMLAGIVVIGGGTWPSTVFTAEAKPGEGPAPAFFARHCQACHSGSKPRGDFRVAELSPDFTDPSNRQQWLDVLEQVRANTMPPPAQPRPSAREIQTLLAWIAEQAAAAETARNASQGRVVLRRLNRTEYENTVRDLLGVDLDLKDLLPAEVSAGGFDNQAEALHVSSYLMEQYLEAADRVLDAAIASGPRPRTIRRRFDIRDERTVKPTGSVYRHLDDGVAIFSSWASANIQVTLWNFRTHERGRYRFRISGYGFQTQQPVMFHVMAGTLTAVTEQHLVDYFTVPPNDPREVEFVERLEPRSTIRIIADGLGVKPPDVQKVGAENYQGPGLVVQWVDVEGPLIDSWPPRSHRLLLGDLPQKMVAQPDGRERLEVVSEQPLADAERLLRDFARRAFRRVVTDEEIKPFVARVAARLAEQDSFEQALRVGFKAILASPHFLFLREKPGRLDDDALASRLSYFLWSSLPDEELFALAEMKQLSRPEALREQVERMLQDPKAVAFTQNFVTQWLGLRAIDDTVPDYMLYPEYDDVLKVSMVQETLLFFEELLKQDLSLTNFVASDFTMLNGRLAKHYGIPGVEGLEFRKTALPPNSRRGGVLTMASVLKVTANGTTTSPILRGAWVLDRILGTPPPKPTVDIEAVEPDIRGAMTIREQLAKHRAKAECASCHAVIDPPGFALESFDVIGGWRDYYRSVGEGEAVTLAGRRMRYRQGPAVDSADVLPDGRTFRNIDEYKQLLLADPDQLARALTVKLLAYATGATPAAAQQPEIDALVERLRKRNYGLRSLVHEIVQSQIFQHK